MKCGTAAHRPEGGLVDFTKLGYPEARRQALFRPLIFQRIEHISAGQPLHLPQFINPGGQSASRPAATQPGTP